jgi:hypothetical protein
MAKTDRNMQDNLCIHNELVTSDGLYIFYTNTIITGLFSNINENMEFTSLFRKRDSNNIYSVHQFVFLSLHHAFNVTDVR